MISIPFGDVGPYKLCEQKTQPTLQYNNAAATKIYQSTSTVTSSYRSNDTSSMTTRMDNGNYDLSYYFDPSCATTTATTGQEDDKNQDNDNILFRGRSLSIGSTLSSHFINNTSVTTTPYDEFRLPPTPDAYRAKANKSNKKAFQFFGEHIKLEITSKEIRKEGLKALLESSVPLGYFLYHLLNEYSSENLFFFLAVENYQNYCFSSDMERQQVANKIAKAYLTASSDLEVNLEDKVSRSVKTALLNQQRRPSESVGKEFELAKRHVFSLLNVSYHRFRSSSIWDIMDSKCAELDCSNISRQQALVVNVLLAFIKRQKHTSFYKLVHSFCRIYLPHGYKSLNKEEVVIKEAACRHHRSKSIGGSDKKSVSFISGKIDTLFFKNNKTRTK